MSRIILSATAAVRLDENRFRRIVLKRRIWLEIRLICLFRKTYYLNGILRAARDFYTSFDTITSISTRIDNAKIFLKKKKTEFKWTNSNFFFVFAQNTVLKDVFTDSADLTKLSSDKLYLDDMVQQTGFRMCTDSASSYSLTSTYAAGIIRDRRLTG